MSVFFENKGNARIWCREHLNEYYLNQGEALIGNTLKFLKNSPTSANRRILAYKPLKDEPPITEMLFRLSDYIFVPHILPENQMEFRLMENDHSRKNPGNVPEIIAPGEYLASDDIVLVPSLGCDPSGYRLGRGGGYYDRWRDSFEKCCKAGILPSGVTQIAFPAEKHDLRLDLVITEKGIVDFT